MVLSKIKREVGKVKMIAETAAQRTANIKWILDNRIELIEISLLFIEFFPTFNKKCLFFFLKKNL